MHTARDRIPVISYRRLAVAVAATGLLLMVPTHASSLDGDAGVHLPGIRALEARGILDGTECGEEQICPDEPIPRWVVAVWIVRAVDGEEHLDATSSRFDDVDAAGWWQPYVERLAVLGFTRGCAADPARYCPDDVVTRAQVATLIARAFELEDDRTTGFVDIAGSVHASSIRALTAANITVGCSIDPARFCPADKVTWGQMATLLARAMGLIPLPAGLDLATYRIAFTTTEPASENGIWLVNGDGTNPRQIVSLGARPVWSPDGTRIAFEANAGIWLVDAEGTHTFQLTDNGWDPSWSPDGTTIAYTRGITQYNDDGGYVYTNRIWLMDADGSDQRPLSDGATYAVWSPEDTRIVYTETSNTGIWSVNADGTDRQLLTRHGWGPVWSPDGTRIVYGFGGIRIMDADGSGNRQLSVAGAYPVWSPDGNVLAYVDGDWGKNTEHGGIEFSGGIWLVDTYGKSRRQLTDDLNEDSSPFGRETMVWSSDGTRIAYTRRVYEHEITSPYSWAVSVVSSEVAVIDARGTSPRTISSDGEHPAWSPDTTRIAYTGRGGDGIWLAGSSGVGSPKLVDDGSGPIWSPDGTKIAYSKTGLKSYRVWAVDEDGSSSQALADIGGYPVWSPDGNTIAYTDSNGTSIWLTDAYSPDHRQLAEGGRDPVWSPDSSTIVYTDSGGRGIWVMDADGTNHRRLSRKGWGPVWSGDSRQIAYRTGTWNYDPGDEGYQFVGGVWVMDADGTNQRRITPTLGTGDAGRAWTANPGALGNGPDWAPDHTKVAYTDGSVTSGWSVWSMGLDAASPQELTVDGHSPLWSPDGTRVLYTRGGWEVWVMDANGMNQLQLAAAGRCPAWSPDGTRVVYGATHGDGIWLIEADGTGGKQVTDRGACPRWIPAPIRSEGR